MAWGAVAVMLGVMGLGFVAVLVCVHFWDTQREWALAAMRQLGLSNVRAEPVPVKPWRQGPVSLEITAPFPHRLVATALGNSVGTPEV